MHRDPSGRFDQPSLWIHVVHLCRDDEAVHGGGALSAAIGAALFERQMRSSSRKRVKAGLVLERVLHGRGDVVVERELARCSRIQLSRSATNGALSCRRTARRCSTVWPLICKRDSYPTFR
jgi:hypothetical protein